MRRRRRFTTGTDRGGGRVRAAGDGGPAMAGSPPGGLKWGACADPDAAAAGWQCATFKAPKDYGNPAAGSVKIAVTRLPAQDQANRIGALFINSGGPGGSAVDTPRRTGPILFGRVQRPLRHRRLRSARRRPELAAIDCKVNQETDGLYSTPFMTPENLDVKALLAKDKAYVKRCVELNKRILPVRLDRQRRARHGRHPGRHGRQEAELLRLLLRDVPGRDLREPLPRQLPRLRARRPGRRQQLHQHAVGRSARADGGLRARARALLPGLRVRAAFCKFGGSDPWAAYDALVDQAEHAGDPGAWRHGPAPGQRRRHPRRHDHHALQQAALVAPGAGALRGGGGRRHAASASSPTRPGATTSTARSTRAPTATSRSGHRAEVPPDVQPYPGRRRQRVGHVRPLLVQHRLRELNYGLWPIHAKDVFSGPFTASKSAPTVLEVATTYDPATPYRGAKRLATQLGNVRFLTMVGDGHTAYLAARRAASTATSSPTWRRWRCRPRARSCKQEVPFVPPPAAAVSTRAQRASSSARCSSCCGSALTARRIPYALGALHQAPSAYALRPHARGLRPCGSARRPPCSCGACPGCARRPCPRAVRPPGRRAGRAAPRDRPRRAGRLPARGPRGRRSRRRPRGRGRCGGSRARASRWRGRRRRA